MSRRKFPEAKHKAVLANGRDSKKPPCFEDSWTKVHIRLLIHPAWRSLTASAKDVMIFFNVKSGNAARKGVKDHEGRPKIVFCYSEAKRMLKISDPTFRRVLVELENKGFIGVTAYGGISGGKGRAAEYHLSDRWEDWTPPPKDTKNIMKARDSRKGSKIQGDQS